MERRDFIKISGAGALALGAAAAGCAPKKTASASAEEGPEQMVYRDTASQQFTFTGLFFSETAAYSNN